MSSLAEIEAAVVALPHEEKVQLLTFLSKQVASQPSDDQPCYLDSSKYPPIKGLPSDLSVNVKEKVRELLRAKHHAERR